MLCFLLKLNIMRGANKLHMPRQTYNMMSTGDCTSLCAIGAGPVVSRGMSSMRASSAPSLSRLSHNQSHARCDSCNSALSIIKDTLQFDSLICRPSRMETYK